MWGQIAGAAIGAAGSYFGNKQDSHANDPMNPADLYLPSAIGGVNNVMGQVGNLQPQQYYPDSTIAGMNPMMSGSINALYNNPYGNQYQQQMGSFGGQSMDAMSRQLANPNQAFQYNQGVFNQTMGNLMPAMQGSYDAATRDNNRNLNWSQLPGLDMSSMAAGQQGGTKLAQQSALATSMNMDRNADIGASMYQNAVNQAQNAAMSAGTQNLGAQMNLYGIGANALNNAYNMNSGNLQNQVNAGAMQQGYDQSVLGDQVNRFNFNQQEPYNHLGRQMDLYNSSKAGGYGGGRGDAGMNTFESVTNGAMLGANIWGAGQDAGWWGQGSGGGGGGGSGYGQVPVFNAPSYGYQNPQYNLGIPGYSTGY